MITLQAISSIVTISAMLSVICMTIYHFFRGRKMDKELRDMMEKQRKDHEIYMARMYADMYPGKERFKVIDNGNVEIKPKEHE